jgi:hypothetical protein
LGLGVTIYLINVQQYHGGKLVIDQTKFGSFCPTNPQCQHLYDVLRERKPVSPAIAVRLGKLFGDGAGVWVRTQAAYDTWNAERKEDVSKIPTLRAKVA